MKEVIYPNKNALIVTALTGFIRAFLIDDIKILQKMGYQVECMANSKGDDLTKEENEQYFAKIGVSYTEIPFSSTNPFAKDNLKAFGIFREALKRKSYAVIHIHTPIPGVICRIAAATVKSKQVVIYTTHGFYFHKKSRIRDWAVFYPIEKIASCFGDAIITINKEDYETACKMHSPKIYCINGVGVDTRKFENVIIDRNQYRGSLHLAENDIAILSIGELSHRKNHKVIIKALKILNNPNLVYVICGKIIEGYGTYDELKQIAQESGVRVIFLGYRKDIPEIAACCDIGAIPSLREGLGLAGIEMLAAGLPLVASGLHGINDYAVEGITAYTADPNSAESFANALGQLIEKENRIVMREKCVKMAEKYDLSVSHAQREKIYKELLD